MENILPIIWWAGVTTALVLFILGMFACYWTTYAWHSPGRYESTRFVPTRDSTSFSFSMIVPCRDESYEVLNETVKGALAQTHPNVQVLISVGFDDPSTQAAAQRIIAENPGRNVVLSISQSSVHNKPTQLNAALADCTGDIVGILDAESVSASNLLAQVDATFQDSGVSVVQGGVIFTNFESSFVALRSVLEYYAHHRSKMHWSATHGSVLMGGNTVFFRRELLEMIGGWDDTNLAEDAEIAIRLQTIGHNVTVAYDPHLSTLEEAPVRIKPWIKQRTRWNLGFLQTLFKGEWRNLPTRIQRTRTLWHLLQPSIMTLTALSFPLALIIVFTHPPLWVSMLSWAPAIPLLFLVAIEAVMLHIFGQEHGFKIRVRDYVKLVVSTPVYMVMLCWASVRASVKYIKGDFGWEKTTHVGLHHVTPALEGASK